jgi:hypothetical protein
MVNRSQIDHKSWWSPDLYVRDPLRDLDCTLRSLSLKNEVRQASHFCPQLSRSWAVNANSWRFPGSLHFEDGIGTMVKVDAFAEHGGR